MLSVSIKTLVRNTAYKHYSARGFDGVAALGALAERAMGQELTLGEMPLELLSSWSRLQFRRIGRCRRGR
jgi:hypothetical protein